MSESTLSPGHWTTTELESQPAIWERVAGIPQESIDLLPAPGEKVLVLGCGTSYYIGDAYAQLRNDAGLGRTRAAIPSELPWIDDDEHIVVISRSGTTADVIDVVEQRAGINRITAIIGDAETKIGELCSDRIVHLGFADERSIVQTRFATTVLATLRRTLGQDVLPIAEDARRALATALPPRAEQTKHVVFLGHRWTVGLAHEAALKLRESAGMWTEAYPVWEYQHGPISCAGTDTLVWVFGELPSIIREDIAATGATIYTSDLDPMATMPQAHRLGVSLALRAGRNPDTPPHLNRSVKVTQH